MFDSEEELPSAGAAQLAGLIEQNHAELKAAERRMLQLACAWRTRTIWIRAAMNISR